MAMQLTEEQKKIVKVVGNTDNLIINAFAGTGKTHTLEAIARSYPNLKFLVLAYNRSVKKELRERLPSNCQVYTVHGLAYRHFNRKDRIVTENEMADKILELLNLNGTSGYAYCFFLRDLISAYFDSYETDIQENTLTRLTRRHPELRRKMNIIKRYGLGDIQKIKNDVEYVLYAFSKGVLPLVHGYYQKVFQLNLEQYQDYFSKFDVLMIDEGQDLNGVQLYIVERAEVNKKVICGDKHQAIYAWRGAYNALGAFKDWPRFFLTTSFRFRSEKPVKLANAFLRNWKGEKAQMVAGKSQVENNLVAYISRTSAGLLEFVHRLKEPVRFTRDIEDIFRIARVGATIVEYYRTGRKEYLKGVPYYIRLLIEAGEAKSAEELATILVYDVGDLEYGHAVNLALWYNIELLYKKALQMQNIYAKTVLSTAHSAKGLQFDKVNFSDDFPEFEPLIKTHTQNLFGEKKKVEKEDIQRIINGISECAEEQGDILDELNLQYVAVTRAIKELGEGSEALGKNLESRPDVEKLYKTISKEPVEEMLKKLFLGGSG